MTTCTRVLEFDAGHRVLGHGGRCRFLHGHRYKVEVTIQTPALDALGMVIDFGIVKERVGGWIDQYWDHNLLLHPGDPLLRCTDAVDAFGGRDPYIMPNGNPTAENLATVLCNVAAQLLPEFTIMVVKLWETPNCFAECRPSAG